VSENSTSKNCDVTIRSKALIVAVKNSTGICCAMPGRINRQVPPKPMWVSWVKSLPATTP
jgi:hypothetical protein